MINTIKGFSIVNEAEADVFLEFSCFSYDPTDVGNLISGYSAFSKSTLKEVKVLVTQSSPILVTPWTVAWQAPLSMGFSRQEYWSGLTFSSPGVLPNQEWNPDLLHCRQFLYLLSYEGSPSGSSWFMYCWSLAWRIFSFTLLVCEMSGIVQ